MMGVSGKDEARELLLGRYVGYTNVYAPEVLQPIPRRQGREALGIGDSTAVPFSGEDVWHAYELSWLEPGGRPRVAAVRLVVPASSPNLVESKSLKLYLNSVNNTVFPDIASLHDTLMKDISDAAGAAVELELLSCDDPCLGGVKAPGQSVDGESFLAPDGEPHASLLLTTSDSLVTEVLHSHLLRSLCPVTAQPDWATLVIDYTGPALARTSLLQYVVAFRHHQEFHEQCVERIFRDISSAAAPQRLSVQALYTRRGGLDICPWRSTETGPAPRYRLNRQ